MLGRIRTSLDVVICLVDSMRLKLMCLTVLKEGSVWWELPSTGNKTWRWVLILPVLFLRFWECIADWDIMAILTEKGILFSGEAAVFVWIQNHIGNKRYTVIQQLKGLDLFSKETASGLSVILTLNLILIFTFFCLVLCNDFFFSLDLYPTQVILPTVFLQVDITDFLSFPSVSDSSSVVAGEL